MSAERDWTDYAEALREIAGAGESERERQAGLAAEREGARQRAEDNVKAATERRRVVEEKIGGLAAKARSVLDDAGVAAAGPHTEVTIAPGGADDLDRSADALTKRLQATADELKAARASARERKVVRSYELAGGVIVVATLVLVLLVGGSIVDMVAHGAYVVAAALLAKKRFGKWLVALGVGALTGLLGITVVSSGGPWWTLPALLVVGVAGHYIWKKRREPKF